MASEIARCSAIADAGERLRCYDRAAPQAKEPPAKDGAVAKPADFGKPPARPPELAQITASVRELAKTPRGRALFVLDNGQTWRQLDADDTQVLEPAPGQAMKVTIARGLLGSYNLTIKGRNGLIRVRRVE